MWVFRYTNRAWLIALQSAAKDDILHLNAKITALQKSYEDSKDRESQLRASNKASTLFDILFNK
jgi:hypothetical protein